MIFRVDVNMEKLYPHLEEVGIQKNLTSETYFFIRAEDPDEACRNAVVSLTRRILAEKSSPEVIDVLTDISHDVSVTKVRMVKPLGF